MSKTKTYADLVGHEVDEKMTNDFKKRLNDSNGTIEKTYLLRVDAIEKIAKQKKVPVGEIISDLIDKIV